MHTLAVKATNKFEETRDVVKNYINAKHREEIIFTKGATEAINLVANSFGEKFIKWITNPIFMIKNNGWISKTVDKQRLGTGQRSH